MVKIEVIKNRLEQLNASLRKLKRYTSLTLEEFLEDDIVQDVVEYNLFIAINMMIDIAVHIVIDNNLGKVNAMGDAFEILYKEKYITKNEMTIYKNMVAFRNILSHEYVKIDKNMVYEIMQKNLIDFNKFILFINDSFM